MVLVLKQRCIFMGFFCVEITYMSTYVRKNSGDVSKPGSIGHGIGGINFPDIMARLAKMQDSWKNHVCRVFLASHFFFVRK